MFKSFRNIRPGVLIAHLLITLAYPLAKAIRAPKGRLLVFADTLTIIALVLVIFGILYSIVLHGDFDRSGFVVWRGLRRGPQPDYARYEERRKEEREAAFNYPLFLGLFYLLVCAVLAWGVL